MSRARVALVSIAGALALLLFDVPASAQVVADIRVHGNHTTPDAEVLSLAGIGVGQAAEPDIARKVAERLRRSGRFDDVEVRLRYRSLSESGDVALVILVREHPVPDPGPQTPVLAPIVRTLRNGMFLPIVDYTDGYGLTYGLRTTFPGTFGRDSAVSVPLSWGATRRAALEVGRTFRQRLSARVEGGAAFTGRENPFYRVDDNRREAWMGVFATLAPGIRAGAHASLAGVSFDGLDDRLFRYGVDVALDTRQDPVFPRNALYARLSWDRLETRASHGVNRYGIEGRAYAGLAGQAVVLVRAMHAWSDGSLPVYERYLLGGGASLPSSASLRGYRAGSFSGDSIVSGTVELRVPLDSPLSVGKAGISFFADTGAAYDRGTRLRDARFHHGAGGGVFLLVSVFQVSVEMGVREQGGTRFHVLSGFQF